MAKVPERYLEVDPWAVIEKGFHVERNRVSESIFSLGNEYMGVRGYFEEGYSGDSLQGSYFNGLYEETTIPHPQVFNGFSERMCFMVNTVDWLYTRIIVDGEQLDLAKSKFSQFQRNLDLKKGTLERSFVWETKSGKQIRLSFVRFVSMIKHNLGCLRLSMTSLVGKATVEVETGLDFNPIYEMLKHNYWIESKKEEKDGLLAIQAITENSGQQIYSAFRLASADALATKLVQRDKYIGLAYSLALEEGQTSIVDKIVINYADRIKGTESKKVWESGLAVAKANLKTSFDLELASHVGYYNEAWETCGITIDGDNENQQGVNFSIFQLHQTYHGVDPSLNLGAKGLTGEEYHGWTFWDTETYCLPFYLFNNPKAARNLLGFRHHTLPQAKQRALDLDCKGAKYPFCTIDGSESSGTWQHVDLAIHVGLAVFYGIWHYTKITGDKSFLYKEGIEILIEVSRHMATRGDFSPKNGDYGFWAVNGPDEFHIFTNNNTYTCLLAKKTFLYTAEVIAEMKQVAKSEWQAVSKKVAFDEAEIADWKHKADKMRINYDPKTELYEQHDGYFDLPHVDVDKVPVTEFPIYRNWTYDRIFRKNPIKQADVVLFQFLFSHEFPLTSKLANYEFYERRCIHESSLSPSIYSMVAAEIGKHEDAYKYSLHTSRLDLDDYNRNTALGLHTTAMAAAWLLVVYGFGGMRSDGPVLSFNPSIPRDWKGFSFRILYRDAVLNVKVDKQNVTFSTLRGGKVPVEIFGKPYEVDVKDLVVALPADRRP